MECNKEEARRALDIAKKKVTENDYNGASKFVYKAQYLYPELDGLKQVSMMVNVYISASNGGGGGEADWYGVLGVDPLADDVAVKKQYRKLALLLHPDKNKFHGAEGAFKLVSEAWCLLSDKVKRISYDQMRKSKEVKPRKTRKQQKQPPKQKKQPPNQKKQPPNQQPQPPNKQSQAPNQQPQPPNQQPQPPNKQSQAPNQQQQQPSPQKQPPSKEPNPQKQPPNKQSQAPNQQQQQPSPQKQPPNKEPNPQKQQPSPQKQPPNKQPSPQKQPPNKQPSPQKQPPNKQPQQPSPQKQKPKQPSSNGFGNGRGRGNKRSSNSSSEQKKVGTFLTMCNNCRSEYEYLKAFYLNKTLLCRNCRASFVATEKEKTPQATNNKDTNGVASTCGRDEEDATRGIGNADRGFKKKLRTDDYAGASCGIKV